MKNIDYLKEKKAQIIISVFVRNLYFFIPIILDALYLSKISPEGISGIGVITPLLYLINLFQKSVSQSIVLKAQQINVDNNSERINEEIKKLLAINFYYMLCISVLGIVLFPILITYLNAHVWKLEYEASIVVHTYARWISPRIFFNGAWIYCNAIFKIFFKPEYATKIGFLGVILNTVLNTGVMLLLIDSTYTAAKYLAIATWLSACATVIIGVYYLYRDYRKVVSMHIKYVLDWVRVKSVLQSSAVILFESASSSIVFNIFIMYLARYGSTVIVAFSFTQVLIAVNNSWTSAAHYWNQSYISQMIPEGKDVVERENFNYFLKNFLLFVMIVIGISLLSIGVYVSLIRVFIDHSKSIERYIVLFLIVDMGIQVGRIFNMSSVSTLLMIGSNKYVLWNTFIIKYFLFLLPLYGNDKILGTHFIIIPIMLYLLDEYMRGYVNFLGVKNRIAIS